MTMENGVMKMRPAEGGLEIKPGETVMLKPSSAHLMFLDLKHPLEQGNAVAATLQFEKAGAAQVEFPIAANWSVSPRRGHGRHDDARRRHDADEALRLGGHEKSPGNHHQPGSRDYHKSHRPPASSSGSLAIPPCLVAGEKVCRRATARLFLAIDAGERLPVVIADDEAGVGLLDEPGRREAALGHGSALGRARHAPQMAAGTSLRTSARAAPASSVIEHKM